MHNCKSKRALENLEVQTILVIKEMCSLKNARKDTEGKECYSRARLYLSNLPTHEYEMIKEIIAPKIKKILNKRKHQPIKVYRNIIQEGARFLPRQVKFVISNMCSFI